MTDTLWEIVVMKNPTKNEAEDGASGRVVLGPLQIMAPSKEVAILVAGQSLLFDDMKTPNRLTINVRPF